MQNRVYGFAALLAVIGVSIVVGMILGGKLNSPQVVFAGPDSGAVQLVPASKGGGGVTDFADIVEHALPAVVAVTSAQFQSQEGKAQPDMRDHPFFDDPFFRRFFGRPDDDDGDDGDDDNNDVPRNGPRPQPKIGEGSGFIISHDGYVLTNNHVVENSDRVEIALQDGKTYDAEVVGADPSIDLALLKVDPEGDRLPTLALGDSDQLRVGEWVIAIGNPLEFAQTVTVGVLSGKGRRLPLRSTDFAVVSFLQTDAAINFGNSGGPLLDARGNVVGINTAINRQYLAEGIGFALPINQARRVMEQLREQGFVRRGFIGITMNRSGLDEAAQEFYQLPDTDGVIVSEVQDNGPGGRAGLLAGDVIRKVDDAVVKNNFDLVSQVASRQPGDKVKLEVFRKETTKKEGRTLRIDVTLADRDEGMTALGGQDRQRPQNGEDDSEVQEATGFGVTVEKIGARMRERLGLEEGQDGLVVTDVDYGSAAFNKGVRANMVIFAINDEPVATVADWNRALAGLAPGSSAKLDVLDGRQAMYFFLKLPEAEGN